MFAIGQQVKISNSGKLFSTYANWAEVQGLDQWTYGLEPNVDSVFTIVSRGYHPAGYDGKLLYGVKDEHGKQFVMGEDGLTELVKDPVYRYQWVFQRDQNGKFFVTGHLYTQNEFLEFIDDMEFYGGFKIIDSKKELPI